MRESDDADTLQEPRHLTIGRRRKIGPRKCANAGQFARREEASLAKISGHSHGSVVFFLTPSTPDHLFFTNIHSKIIFFPIISS